MKPIMNLYSDKVTITDKKELLPLAKKDNVYVAGSPESGIIYTNVSKETLDKLIVEGIQSSPHLTLLKLAIDTSEEVKTIPDLKISEEGKVFVEDTVKANVLMTNCGLHLIIVEVNDKIYTNNAKIASLCIQHDFNNGKIEARLLFKLIEAAGGLVECEMRVM